MSCYIIAEAGVNHNGDINKAFALCDAAKEANVDAVKFQTFKTEELLLKNTSKALYQIRNTGNNQSQYEMIKKMELSFEEFKKIKEYCDRINIQFLSTPDDGLSLDFLCSLKIPLIKIGSGEINNIPFLRKIAEKRLPVILSTGMSTLGDVEKAVVELKKYGASEITLLHCTTNYPCSYDEVNLNAMITLKNSFKVDTGYSDHTIGIIIPVSAVALGASVIEKHFTLDKSMEGPDHKASLNPVELKEMVENIRKIERALGDGIKKPNKSELEIKKNVQRSIVASNKIIKGDILSEKNMSYKRTGMMGIPVDLWDFVIGKKAVRNFQKDEIISKGDITLE